MNLENKKILIHTITPLFIGSGESFSPLTFWINSEKCELIEFPEEEFVASLSEQEKNSLGKLDLLDFMKLIYNKRGYLSGKTIPISPNIADIYKAILNGRRKEFNKFDIKKLVTNINTHQPYIPGSSLKGALRTGYLAFCPNLVQRDKNIDEGAALGGCMSKDVFSTLKVGDCVPVGEIQTRIIYALRCHKNKDKSGIPTMLQIIMGGSSFSGEITFIPADRIAHPFKNITDVLEKVEKYSVSLLADEKIGIKYPSLYNLQSIKKEFNNPVYLCRIGGLIGAESHTIDNFRSINIKIGKKDWRSLPYTTCTICAAPNDKTPTNISFGWCLIEVLNGPASKNLPAFQALVAEQEDLLQDKSYRSTTKPISNSRPVGVVLPKETYNREQIYSASVVGLSKKGKALVQVIGKTTKFTLMEAGYFEIGQALEITQIQGTTCKLNK